MEFDRTRWVAPGVPRVSRKYIDSQIELMRAKPEDFLSVLAGKGRGVEWEGEFLSTMENLSDKFEKQVSGSENLLLLKRILRDEFLYWGAITHYSLVGICQEGQGFSFEEILKSHRAKAYLDKIKSVGGRILNRMWDHFISDLKEKNRHLFRGLLDIEGIAYARNDVYDEFLGDPLAHRVLLTFRGSAGMGFAFHLLNGQRQIYNLKDQLGAS